MSDQAQEKPEKKSGARPIGGIGQYATIGGGTKRSDLQTPARPDVETSNSPDFQTSRLPEVETIKSLDIEQSRLPGVKKSKHPDWKQQTIYLPPSLIKWLKIQAVQEDREISEIATDALMMYQDHR